MASSHKDPIDINYDVLDAKPAKHLWRYVSKPWQDYIWLITLKCCKFFGGCWEQQLFRSIERHNTEY